jgi:hypothetical protein
MVRLLILLLGMLSTSKVSDRRSARYAGGRSEAGDPWERLSEELREPATAALPSRIREEGTDQIPFRRTGRKTRRRRIPLWMKWTAIVALTGLIFRKVIAFGVITALSVALHLVGLNVHLPHVKLAWPWQSVTAGTTTNVDLGPWVLQKIEGISKPALGRENFNFVFTHKVSKNIGFWPCWYSSTFYAVGRASATVDLNPGPSWWTKASGHYRLQMLSRPIQGKPGRVSVAIVLPQPQLPRSAHDVSIDNGLSQPLNVQHSWTYPGFGCGVLVRPQFSPSVLYALAQRIAFDRVRHTPQVYQPLIAAAENEATQMIRDNFIQPTVNAFGYTLASFSVHWAPATS